MTLVDKATTLLADNLSRYETLFTNPVERFYWLYLVAFVLGAAVLYFIARDQSSDKSAKGLFRFIFPIDDYLQNSTLVDLKLYIANKFFGLTRFVALVFGITVLASWTTGALTSIAGPAPFDLSYTPLIVVLFTLYSVMVGDFGSFANHAIHHKVPFLWEIHRVHHSAEVLTPLTQHRKHPMYDVNRAIIRSLIVGTLIAPAFWLLGDDPTVLKILGINAVSALFNLTSNFRHSRIWICYGPVISKFLVSPAQHQIHHSSAEHHMDKNFGQIFAIWDWMFGTLYVPREREQLTYGVDRHLPQEYTTLWQAYWRPAVRMMSLLRTDVLDSPQSEERGATPKSDQYATETK